MKKIIIACSMIILLVLGVDYLRYHTSIYINFNPDMTVTTTMGTDAQYIYKKEETGWEQFTMKGMNMGVGIPGHFATDFAIDKETYLRWFAQMQEMGVNTLRVYTILQDDFYEAFYEYNKNNSHPLYLLHGVWVNDYVQNSRMDAYSPEFKNEIMKNSRIMVDVIHGNRKVSTGRMHGGGTYKRDISPWVIGYILGVEWEDVTVAYTNGMNKDKRAYRGTYMYTTEDAEPFEVLLAQVGDYIIEYESKRYKEQRLVAFSNWPTTDPFDYPEDIMRYFKKCAKVDVEHIKTTEAFLAGTFASYHVYPYYPDYLSFFEDSETLFLDETGSVNTYRAYLKMLTDYHTIPVVISEFGVPTSRSMAQQDKNRGYNQGRIAEKEQGEIILDLYHDIKEAGCAGGVVFTWQDEWFKRTWNTMHAVDLTKTPYWSDYQTNEQYFGILSFDPGQEKSISYVDGNISEWLDTDLIVSEEEGTVSMKYDEKFIYFLVHKKNYNKNKDVLYIPIDTTQKTGSNYAEPYDVKFDRQADFLIRIDGENHSRVLVQERYEVLRAMYYENTHKKNAYENPPEKDTPIFKNINQILQTAVVLQAKDPSAVAEVYETGILTYGNANPESSNFNSLADFCINGEYVEIKIPWQIFNFSNPSQMQVHDDYYDGIYGIENITINQLYVGLGSEETKKQIIEMSPLKLKGWNRKVTSHERLKKSYDVIQEKWREE